MNAPARRIFWHGVTANDPDKRLRLGGATLPTGAYRGSLGDFEAMLEEVEQSRRTDGRPALRELFDRSGPWIGVEAHIPRRICMKPAKS